MLSIAHNNGIVGFIKPDSIGYSDSKALSIIIKYPYARFETIGMMDYIKEKGVIVINSILWNQLSLTDIKNIDRICNDKIDSYYLRFTK